ncbi:MAG: ketopantoate reductase family protein [Deltaproteobacteria bacterium]|nr:ketopantoate reductase family protein [Deltaproteobacteria bacterium]
MSASRFQILIAGCGAIGSIFACLLRKAGHEVTLLGRAWHLNAIRATGLEMDGLWGRHHAEGFKLATRLTGLSDRYDLILISVKAYDTERIVRQLVPFLGQDGIAISLQNGLGNVEALAEALGPQKSLGASILVGARILEPGQVTVTVQAAPIIIGPLDPTAGSMEKCRLWVSLFSRAGIPSKPTEQILSHIWAKVFYNAPLNPLGALLEVHYGALGQEPELKAIMDRIIGEAFEVADKKGVQLLWKSAGEYRELFYEKLLPATYNHQSSMLQDLQRGRPTEINSLNAKIWRYGKQSGIPTPFNETMTRLMLGREKRPEPPGPSLHTATGPDP